jgi:hypothetical protein
MKQKLRIGVLLRDFDIPFWEFQILNSINNSDFAELILVIKNNTNHSHKEEAKGGVAIGAVRLIENTDRLIFKTHTDFKRRKDISGLFINTPKLELNDNDGMDNKLSGNSLLTEIRNFNIDIILSLGCHDLNPGIPEATKYGIWSHSIDTCRKDGSPSTGFWEVIRKSAVTNSRLEILKADKKSSDIIYSAWESTCPYSINVNRDSLSWRTALFAPRIMKGISEHGDSYLASLKARFINEKPLIEHSMKQISLTDAVGSIFRYIRGVSKSIFKKLLFTDAFRWQLQFDINSGARMPSDTYGSFRKLLSPKGIFWADPFVVAGDDCYWIFVEEFIYKKDKAHLSVLKLDKQGKLLDSHKIIERPYHMSYPFVFRIGDQFYMIPETSRNKTIELYKCMEFPYKWEFERNIMENVSAVDSTLFHYDDKWWLFTAMDQTGNISGCSAELFLFYTDDIFSGQWKSHRLNPIVSDIRTARPAGKIFLRDGEIFRPSQNCAGRYGIAFNLSHITKLTTYEYEETLVTEVKPEWDNRLKGTHTLNFDKDFTIVDAYSFRSRLSI